MSLGMILLIIWSLVGLIYIIVDVKATLQNQAAAREIGQREGVESTIMQAMQLAENCQPVPLFAGEKKITLVNPECAQPAPTQAPETTE